MLPPRWCFFWACKPAIKVTEFTGRQGSEGELGNLTVLWCSVWFIVIEFLFFLIAGLCPDCSDKLNYHHKKKEISKQLKQIRDAADAAAGGSSSEDNTAPSKKSDCDISMLHEKTTLFIIVCTYYLCTDNVTVYSSTRQLSITLKNINVYH